MKYIVCRTSDFSGKTAPCEGAVRTKFTFRRDIRCFKTIEEFKKKIPDAFIDNPETGYTREKIKEELFEKSILEKLSEEIDSFTATKGKSPSRIYVCAKALDLLLYEVAAGILVCEGDFNSLKKQDKPLDLHIYGLKVYRRFDEVSEEQLFVLE